jgi:AcrR family transcriptional regulator
VSRATSRSGADRPRKRLPRATLSRELIIEAAERVAHRDGLDRLTFQSIGKELGAHPTSVYRHFRDKDELVLELIDTLRARSYGGTLKSSGNWRDDLRQVAQVIHRHYLRYPEFALDMASRTTRRSTEFNTVEFALDALKRSGLAPAEAALCLRAYGNMVRSVAAMEASMQALPPESRTADDLAWQVEYRSLPDDEFPNIAEHRDELTALSDPRIFDTAVEMMLDAIELRARKARKVRRD